MSYAPWRSPLRDNPGRDLRAIVNQAVLTAVKRTSSPKDLALSEADFAITKETHPMEVRQKPN
jgi:hypothetical protein